MSIKERLLGSAFQKLLAHKSRASLVERAVPKTSLRATLPTRDQVTVAAVQMEFDLLDDAGQYAKKIYTLASQAVELGAQIVSFPEYAWTPLIGMLPGVHDLAGKVTGGLESAANHFRQGAGLANILHTVAPYVQNAFLSTGTAVSRALGVFLMSGSTITRDDRGRLFNVAYLFGPHGEAIGAQRKLHAFTTERDWLTVGGSLEVFDLGFTSVALPVCMDFTYWETVRLAWLDGAEILFNPSADAMGDEEYSASRGVRARVQEAPAYGILSNMVTDLFGLHWRGPSWIVAPLGLERGSILAQSATSDREEVVVTELDLKRLREFRHEHHFDFNEELHSHYFPHVYEAYRQRLEREGRRVVK